MIDIFIKNVLVIDKSLKVYRKFFYYYCEKKLVRKRTSYYQRLKHRLPIFEKILPNVLIFISERTMKAVYE